MNRKSFKVEGTHDVMLCRDSIKFNTSRCWVRRRYPLTMAHYNWARISLCSSVLLFNLNCLYFIVIELCNVNLVISIALSWLPYKWNGGHYQIANKIQASNPVQNSWSLLPAFSQLTLNAMRDSTFLHCVHAWIRELRWRSLCVSSVIFLGRAISWIPVNCIRGRVERQRRIPTLLGISQN